LRRSDCFSSSYLGEASRASSAHFEPKVGISAPAPFLALRDASPIDEIRRHGERPMKASRAFPSAHSDQSSLHFWRFTMPRWAWRKVSEASRPEFRACSVSAEDTARLHFWRSSEAARANPRILRAYPTIWLHFWRFMMPRTHTWVKRQDCQLQVEQLATSPS